MLSIYTPIKYYNF